MKHNADYMEDIDKELSAREAACRILDVSDTADGELLKKAYRRAAVKYHPDHNGNTAEANELFALVQCAYQLLAFGRPCEKLLEENNKWYGEKGGGKYSLDNMWGQFLWWRERFFEHDSELKNKKGSAGDESRASCI
jgi:hypothetical protein